MKPRVLLDCDDVLADFIGEWLAVVNEEGGVEIPRDRISGWNFFEPLVEWHAEEKIAEFRKTCFERTSRVGFCESLKVLPGAQEAVAKLKEEAELYVVTSPWRSGKTWTHERDAWLKKHFDIHHSRVVHTCAKHLVGGHMLVDDKEENVTAWTGLHEGVGVLWGGPESFDTRQASDLTDGIVSLRDWNSVFEILDIVNAKRRYFRSDSRVRCA